MGGGKGEGGEVWQRRKGEGGRMGSIGKVGRDGVPFGRLCSLVVETRGAGGR